MNSKTYTAAKKIWDYHHLNQKLEKADCVLVLGNHDPRTMEWAAQLFSERWAPFVVISGGEVDYALKMWGKSEADYFFEVGVKNGIPSDKILLENQAKNTGENAIFTRRLLEENRIACEKILAIQKPYMERRTFATFKKQWPEINVIVSSPPISFGDYVNTAISEESFLNRMVADLQKIRVYPELGFQIKQEIPNDVWGAFEEMVRQGYSKYLVRNINS